MPGEPRGRLAALLAVAVALTAAPAASAQAPPPLVPTPAPPPLPCQSRAVGKPWQGRLACGVQLPAETATFTTWDLPLGFSPNEAWRRWGTAQLVATIEAIAADYQLAFGPGARMVVGDLSRPRGGSFGRKYGGAGHASHQNGRDVDIFYPRRDGQERPPGRPGQVDRMRAQWLVDRAAREAQFVFVGRRVHLLRHFKRVQYLPSYHEDHLHLRIPQPAPPQPTP